MHIATEDGSVGTKGTVIDAIEAERLKADVIFACGADAHAARDQKYCIEHGSQAFISLEERMACGVGVCLGCVVKTREVDHHSHVKNARICTDGPVYDAMDVEI